jgi:preprotein translocase subunit SecY
MNYPVKYIIAAAVGAALIGAPYYFPKESLQLLFTVWFMLIPVAFIVFLVYGIIVYLRGMKHRITVLAGREAGIRSVKRGLYEELINGIKKG